MIYVQQPPTIEAHKIITSEQAAQITGHEPATPAEGEDWAVEWPWGDIRLHLGGRTGDYLVDQRVIPAAEFEARWVPVTSTLRTSTLREGEIR